MPTRASIAFSSNDVRPAAKPLRRPVQAVILAAGRGSRLEHLTEARPKCLVEVGGSTLLERQLATLAGLGIDDVTIVTGYRADEIRHVVGGRARYVTNDAWASTNSLYSVSLCRDCIRGDMLVMNCDVLAHPQALRRLLDVGPNAFLYDSSSGGEEEEMKVEFRQGRLTAMRKDLPAHRSDGENVGILHFDASATRALFRHAGDVLAEGGRNAWMAQAVERLSRTVPLRGIDVADLPWIEIDFPEDLERAQRQVWPRLRGAFAEPPALAA